MGMYTRKPSSVEAKQFLGSNGYELAEWIDPVGTSVSVEPGKINFKSNDRNWTAKIDDWVINENATFSVLPDERFKEWYTETVTEPVKLELVKLTLEKDALNKYTKNINDPK